MLLLIVLGVLAWYFVYRSGVHATIAGVALGLVMARRPGGRAAHALEPWSNAVILPLFAFTAAMVPVPQVSPSDLDPAFWGILVGLPVGKIVGITHRRRPRRARRPSQDAAHRSRSATSSSSARSAASASRCRC